MIRYMFNKFLVSMQNRYDYDVSYMQEILNEDLSAFIKFMGFQTMSSHMKHLPVEQAFAARIRAIIWDDCGPCTQLVVNMALEAGVEPDIVQAIVAKDLDKLPEETRLVVEFTELVLAHNPEADELRKTVENLWGRKGVITLAYCISSCRVYPAVKYAMGYGQACSRIDVNETSLSPNRNAALALGA